MATSHPSARLVLPLQSINDLLQKVNGALGELEKQGVLRKGGAAGPGGTLPSAPYTQ